ncbi:hypothetical protein CCP3SC15_5410003 [Gammaproteobacteria bacterium]
MSVCRLMTGATVWHLTADPAAAGWLALYAQRLELSAATPEEQPARRLHLSGPVARLPAEAVPLLHFSDLEIAVLPSDGDLYACITPRRNRSGDTVVYSSKSPGRKVGYILWPLQNRWPGDESASPAVLRRDQMAAWHSLSGARFMIARHCHRNE